MTGTSGNVGGRDRRYEMRDPVGSMRDPVRESVNSIAGSNSRTLLISALTNASGAVILLPGTCTWGFSACAHAHSGNYRGGFPPTGLRAHAQHVRLEGAVAGQCEL